jgi:hypothetical protein
MGTSRDERPKLFLTFSEGDLPIVRPVAASLRLSGGGLALDYAVLREPFVAERSDLIRASLALRLKHSAAAVCLIGAGTAADEWVRWTLTAASELRLPLFGASLVGPPPADALDLLAGFGAEIVPLDGAVIARCLTGEVPRTGARVRARAHEHPLSFAVRFMRHPLR